MGGEFVVLPCQLYIRLTKSVAVLHSSVLKVRVGKRYLNFLNSFSFNEEYGGRFDHIFEE